MSCFESGYGRALPNADLIGAARVFVKMRSRGSAARAGGNIGRHLLLAKHRALLAQFAGSCGDVWRIGARNIGGRGFKFIAAAARETPARGSTIGNATDAAGRLSRRCSALPDTVARLQQSIGTPAGDNVQAAAGGLKKGVVSMLKP
jgi:hypothetical protein